MPTSRGNPLLPLWKMMTLASLFMLAVPTSAWIPTSTTTGFLLKPTTGRILSSSSSRLLSSPETNTNSNSNSNLPPIPGDYDWDAKFGGDADWTTQSDAVPGMTVMSDLDLARQVTALGALEETWRRERIATEYADSANVGWVPTAELANGRFAMFFLVTGLLTELWTGVSLPGQVEELLRVSGAIGL